MTKLQVIGMAAQLVALGVFVCALRVLVFIGVLTHGF